MKIQTMTDSKRLNPFCFGVWGLSLLALTYARKESCLNPFCFGVWGLSLDEEINKAFA